MFLLFFEKLDSSGRYHYGMKVGFVLFSIPTSKIIYSVETMKCVFKPYSVQGTIGTVRYRKVQDKHK